MENETMERAKTLAQTDQSCPQCGAAMQYDPGTGSLRCPYCEYRQDVADRNAPVAEQDIRRAKSTGGYEWGKQQKQVICRSCGAEAIYDALEVADVCPFCGSNHVMEAQMDDSLPPNGVCPFEISAEAAGTNFTKWLKRRWYVPRAAKKNARPNAFKGIYMPYWTFDSDTFTIYKGKYGKDRTVTDRDGHSSTVTDWRNTSGTYAAFIDDELVIGTTRHDPGILHAIEPFNLQNTKPYNPEYLSGFIAERYSIGLDEALTTGKMQMKSRLEGEIREKIKREHRADHGRVTSMEVSFTNITYKYLVLPLWASAFTFRNKVYQFMVNGQTGRVGGKAPVSAVRVTLAILIGLVILALLLYFNQQ